MTPTPAAPSSGSRPTSRLPNDLAGGPDNITGSPWGGLFVAEDGLSTQHLLAVAADGTPSVFARNAVSASEVTGITFSPDGLTLFAGIQDEGPTSSPSPARSGRGDRRRLPPPVVAGDDVERHRRVDLDGPRPVGNGRAMEEELAAFVRPHGAVAGVAVERGDRAVQWTILAMASSTMSLAPASFSAGMRVLMSDLGTTVSTA